MNRPRAPRLEPVYTRIVPLPAFLAPAVINDDRTGLDEEDEADLVKAMFLLDGDNEYYTLDPEEEPYFSCGWNGKLQEMLDFTAVTKPDARARTLKETTLYSMHQYPDGEIVICP